MIRPLTNHVFIKRFEEDNKTVSGIVLPDSVDQNNPIKGTIIALGPDCTLVKMGDTVLFKKYGPDELSFEGEKYLVGEESDILAIIE